MMTNKHSIKYSSNNVKERNTDSIHDNGKRKCQQKVVKKMRATTGSVWDRSSQAIQCYKIYEHDDVNGVIAGDPGVNKQKVEQYINLLQQLGANWPSPISVTARQTMRYDNREHAIWDWIHPDELDQADLDSGNILGERDLQVVTDGHHRLVAYYEINEELPDLEEKGNTGFGYEWSSF